MNKNRPLIISCELEKRMQSRILRKKLRNGVWKGKTTMVLINLLAPIMISTKWVKGILIETCLSD